MKRYAFIGETTAEGTMVCIVQQDGPSHGVLIDAHICPDRDEIAAYLNEWLGTDRLAQPVYVRSTN